MLSEWHEFYTLLGTAAAALVALLFVAASIASGFLNPARAGGIRTYMSPVVFHYAAVLFASLIALVPTQTPQSLGLSIGLLGAGGAIYSIFIVVRLFRDDVPDLADHLGYGALPLAAYAAVLVAAWLLTRGAPSGVYVLASAFLLLLMVNIRNAWDLTLAFIKRQSEVRASAAQAGASQPPSP